MDTTNKIKTDNISSVFMIKKPKYLKEIMNNKVKCVYVVITEIFVYVLMINCRSFSENFKMVNMGQQTQNFVTSTISFGRAIKL